MIRPPRPTHGSQSDVERRPPTSMIREEFLYLIKKCVGDSWSTNGRYHRPMVPMHRRRLQACAGDRDVEGDSSLSIRRLNRTLAR